MNGVIKRLKTEKGFGFIAGEDNNEYFFHRSAVVENGFDELNENQKVVFKDTNTSKGFRAELVRPE